jgi:hypothetical protein
MEFNIIVCTTMFVLSLWLFKKKKPKLTISVPSWSPLEIIYLEQNQKSVADKATGTVHSTKKGTPSFSKLFGELPSSSDSETDVISQKAVYFSFPRPAGEEHNTEDTAVTLRRPLVTSYIMLDTSDSDILMSECPECLVLPLT